MHPRRKLLSTLSTALAACVALTSAPALADDGKPATPAAPAPTSRPATPAAPAPTTRPATTATPAPTKPATPATPAPTSKPATTPAALGPSSHSAPAPSPATAPGPAPAGADPSTLATDCTGPDAAACFLARAHALKETQPGEAAKLYLASWRLDPKIDPLAGYGLALVLAQQYVAAAEALERAVEEYEKLDVKFRESNADASTMFAVIHRLDLVREELRKLAPHVGRVRLTVTDKLPAGMTVVRKGGDDVRSSDLSKLIVKAGGDVLVFTYASGRTVELPVNVVGGVVTNVDVPPEPAAPQAPMPVLVEDEEDPGAEYQKWAYVSGTAGVALTAGGVMYVAFSDSPGGPLAVVLIGGGLVGLGGAAYLWFLAEQERKKADDDEVTITPVVHEQMIGAVLSGTF